MVSCQQAWGFPWLSCPGTADPPASCPHHQQLYLLSTSSRELGRLGQKLRRSSSPTIPWASFPFFAQDSWGIALSQTPSAILSYHYLLLPLAIPPSLPPLSPPGRALAHHLDCTANDLMLLAGLETTFFAFLPIAYKGTE